MNTYRYYVYAYLRESDNTPYYIGKGTGRRAFDKRHGIISVPNNKSKIIFLEKNLSNVGACALERRYIRWYGRKTEGGILLNKTEGGEGRTEPRSKEWCDNHSRMLKGRKHKTTSIEKMKTADKSYMKTEEYRKRVSEGKKRAFLLRQMGGADLH